MKGSESLQEASRKPPGNLGICALSPPPVCSAHSHVDSWTRSRLHNLLSAVTGTNKLEWPKNSSSIVRLSHECDVKIFLLFAISISLRWIKLIGFFLGGGGGGGRRGSITFAQCNTRKFAETSNLSDNPRVKYLFLIFIIFLGGGP